MIRMLLDGLILAVMAVIMYQDFKTRSIVWVVIPALIVFFMAQNILTVGLGGTGKNFLINFLFYSMQLLLISFYFSIKKRKLVRIADNYLGWGDILFLLTLCLAFSPVNFLVFYLVSLSVVLLTSLIYRIAVKQREFQIPLAGGIAIAYSLCLVMDYLLPAFDRFNDTMLITLMKG